jgi:hypothetical protein
MSAAPHQQQPRGPDHPPPTPLDNQPPFIETIDASVQRGPRRLGRAAFRVGSSNASAGAVSIVACERAGLVTERESSSVRSVLRCGRGLPWPRLRAAGGGAACLAGARASVLGCG